MIKVFLSKVVFKSPRFRCLESWFVFRSDSNRHRFAAITDRTIRVARPKTVRIAVKALLLITLKTRLGFKNCAI